MVNEIPPYRYDALAGYSRLPSTFVVSEELEWYEHSSGRLLGVLILDRVDEDFGGIIMGRDERRRFRCIHVSDFRDDAGAARRLLFEQIERLSASADSEFEQGGSVAAPIDIFIPVVPVARLNPAFLRLSQGEGFSPARVLIEEMMHFFEDVDGNFVEQFQTTAFDARFSELYLFALLTEQRMIFDRSYHAPDFVCEGIDGDLFVESATVNPSRRGDIVIEPPVPSGGPELKRYLADYMPIKWGGPLFDKLRKRYWELDYVRGKPIVFAIQDFHAPRAMTFTGSTLLPYLYGRSFTALYDEAGELHIQSRRVAEHRWGEKVIPSGFFDLPGAEHVSAVIHNPTATISKFNRMGWLAKLGSSDVKMVRFGTAYRHNRNAALPAAYVQRLDDPRYTETWDEGLNVYHNPFALHPLTGTLFPGATHHMLQGDDVVSYSRTFHPYSAETMIFSPKRLPYESGGRLVLR
jgi:hypothetical protein